jgi:hypothetical protein
MHSRSLPLSGRIFEAPADAGVMQDKITPRRYTTASGQPWSAGGVAFQRPSHTKTTLPAFERPKHHGSNKRQLVPVTGCIPRFIAEQLERMRDQGGRKRLSRSAVVASLVVRGVQHNIDMQYGATLEPVIKGAVTTTIRSETDRSANLAREAFYSAEQVRILTIQILHLFLQGRTDVLTELIDESQDEALDNMKPYVKHAEGGGEYPPWQSSSSNTSGAGRS